MKQLKIFFVIISLSWFHIVEAAPADLQRWTQGLSGSRLSSYSGSVISSNSSLTIINFCKNGRYNYQKDAGWLVQRQAAGASKSQINGSWKIVQQGVQFFLSYVTDGGDSGQFLLYLQANGRVNVGGVGYAVEKGRAEC